MIRRARQRISLVLVLLAGCGGAAGGEEGTAQLWVTRDRGTELLVDAEVEAGQTLMRALASKADVETRYGGRYVQSVNGIEGEPRRPARLVLVRQRLRGRPQRRLVPAARRRRRVARLPLLGAGRGGARRRRRVPEPFVHGYGGKTRPVVFASSAPRDAARTLLARTFGAVESEPLGTPVPEGANVLEVRDGRPPPDGASCSARPPAIQSGSSSAATPTLTRRYSVP